MAGAIHGSLGGLFEPTGRITTPFQEGEEGKGHLQIYHTNSYVSHKLADIKKNGGNVTPRQWETYTDDLKTFAKDRDLIDQHFDRRIQLFFMQLITCSRTPFHFEWAEADDQYGKGRDLKLKNPSGVGSKEYKTEGAHSSTLPCLIAYLRDEWEKYQKEGGQKPKGFVYLKYSHLYHQHNATMELPRFVNRAECEIDGTHTNHRLRNDAIKLINDVAEGKYGPSTGIKKFRALFEKQINKLTKQINELDPRFLVLEFYFDKLQEVAINLETGDGAFDKLLGVKVDDNPKEKILRDVVYKRRFRLIQKCEDIESRIARDILDTQNRMLKSQSRSLNKIDYRLRYVLLEDMDPIFRRKLERLFCTSLEQLQTGLENNQERIRKFEGISRIRTFRRIHRGEILKLRRNLRVRFQELNRAENLYRAELFKGLREELHGWKGREFTEHFKKKHPDESMSTPMVSRLEQLARVSRDPTLYKTPLNQRRKEITIEKAKKIADTFEIDPGLFLPAIVSSMY